MSRLNILGKVVYASPPFGAAIAALGVTVKIVDRDLFVDDDVIFEATTDGAGNFGGLSGEWDDQLLDVMALQVQVTERQNGDVSTPWLPYHHQEGERTTVQLPWGLPNLKRFGDVLVVAGSDVFGNSIYGTDTGTWDYGARLMALLYTMPPGASPVHRGSHDFWITFPTPSLSEPSSHRAQDELPFLPWERPYGGIIHMNEVPNMSDPTDIGGKVGTLIHEIGHRWLVPPEIVFTDGDTRVRLLREEEYWRAVNGDTPFDGATMLGRDNSHWSPFWQADRSVMDGVSFDADVLDGVARWRGATRPGDTIRVDGLPDFPLFAKYNHLEQVIMGMRRAQDAYAALDGRVHWLEPRLTAPVPYFAGLFVGLASDDFIEFGYLDDQRTIAVVRNGTVIASTPSHNELQRDAVELTVERFFGSYRFSIGGEQPLGCLALLFDLLRVVPIIRPPTPSYLAVVDEPSPPIAVGALARTAKGQEIALEAAYSGIILKAGATVSVPGDAPTLEGGLDALPELEWRHHVPAPGPVIRPANGEWRIFLPRVIVGTDGRLNDQPGFDRSGGAPDAVDRVPKIVVRPPAGNFTLTGRVRIHRSTLSPRSGARAFGVTMWGQEKSMPVSGMVLPRDVQSTQVAPPNNTYKAAYIIVARQFSDVSDELIATIDALRRSFDPSFEVATDGNRHTNSSLG